MGKKAAKKKDDETTKAIEGEMPYEQYLSEKRENALRLAMLRESYKFIDGISRGITKIQTAEDKENRWLKYVDCDPLPKAHIPTELRTFLVRLQLNQKEAHDKYFDYLLPVDERSELSQNRFKPNLTRANVQRQQPDLAIPFAENANLTLQVLESIEKVLAQRHLYSESTIIEIELIKENYRQHLWKSLDIMTYNIIGNIDRDMIQLDIITAAYEFKCLYFGIGLYTHRPVQLPPMHERPEKQIVKFEVANSIVTCPRHVRFDNGAIRGLWFSYDHYSDCAPSHNMPDTNIPTKNLLESCRAGLDLKEWLENNRLDKLRADRADYEEILAAEAEIITFGPKKNAVKLIVPPKVTETTHLNVSEEYNRTEARAHLDYIESMHPDNLRLSRNELNLRQYTVLGGTYAFHYVQTPAQSEKFVSRLFQTDVVQPPILQYLPYNEPYRRTVIPSDIELPIHEREEYARLDNLQYDRLIELQIQLSDDSYWWERPYMVRWQPWEESEEFLELPQHVQDYNLNYDKIMLEKSKRLFNRLNNTDMERRKIATLDDFDLNNSNSRSQLYHVITNILLPRLSITYRFENELRDEEEKLEAELKRRAHMRREHEEDLRLEAERRAQLRLEQTERRALRRAARELAEQERLQKLLEDEERNEEMDGAGNEIAEENEETTALLTDEDQEIANEIVAAKSDNGSSLTIISNVHNGEDHPAEQGLVFKSIIQGSPPKELFVVLSKVVPLNIIPNIRLSFRRSIHSDDKFSCADMLMLSTLLNQIALYNDKEQTIFAETDDRTSKAPGTVGAKQKHKKVTPTDSARKDIAKRSTAMKKKKKTLQSGDMASFGQKEELKLIPHSKGRWMTTGINVQSYDPDERIVVFKTSKIGIFAFAADKYIHFPFVYWELVPQANQTALFTIKTAKIHLDIEISVAGYLLQVIEPKKCHLRIPEIAISLDALMEFLKKSNLNIFPEQDTLWYTTQAYVKHDAMCDHAYKCMGQFCQTHQFMWSAWNCLSDRFTAIVKTRELIENRQPEPYLDVKITPFDTYFVVVEELCTPLDQVALAYHMTPPEQEFNCDIYSLLNEQSNEKSKKKQANTNVRLKWNVAELLIAVQPMSYS